MKLRGFTIIELIISIMIIGILAAITLSAINIKKRLAQSRDAHRKSGIQQIAGGLSAYFTQKDHYPQTLNEIKTAGELVTVPIKTSGDSYDYLTNPINCNNTAVTCDDVVLYDQLEAPNQGCAMGEKTYWAWTSATGAFGKICKPGSESPQPDDTPTPD